VRNIFAGPHIEHHWSASPPVPSMWASICIYPSNIQQQFFSVSPTLNVKIWTLLEREKLFKWLFPFISPHGAHCILIMFTSTQTQFHTIGRPFFIQHSVSIMLVTCCFGGNDPNMQKIGWTSKGEGKTKTYIDWRWPNDSPNCQHLNSLSFHFCSSQWVGSNVRVLFFNFVILIFFGKGLSLATDFQ
jgi:hypothetical protein